MGGHALNFMSGSGNSKIYTTYRPICNNRSNYRSYSGCCCFLFCLPRTVKCIKCEHVMRRSKKVDLLRYIGMNKRLITLFFLMCSCRLLTFEASVSRCALCASSSRVKSPSRVPLEFPPPRRRRDPRRPSVPP